jgi:protein-S-isoprenylcysteine O-methyltransferase Ste14
MTGHLRFAATAAAGAGLNLAAFLPPLMLGGGWHPAREPAALAFVALTTLWIVIEACAVHAARREVPAPDPTGALPWISAAAVFVALWLALYERGSFVPFGAAYGAVVGGTLMVAGIALRTLAILTLGPCFLDAAAVLSDHELIVRGVYRHVRHPAELGTLCLVLGAALLLGSAVALGAIVPLAGLAVWRIRGEEAVLWSWHPAEWSAYRRAVPALIPGIPVRPRRRRLLAALRQRLAAH